METADITRRLTAHDAAIARLSSIFEHPPGKPHVFTVVQIPHWDVVRQTTGTFTPGTDWESQFDNKGQTNRLEHTQATMGGEIPHVNSDSSATRHTILFSSQGAGVVLAYLGIVGTGRVQVKANGVINEYTASATINLKVNKAPLTNRIVVMSNGTGGAFQYALNTQLFDGVNRIWQSI